MSILQATAVLATFLVTYIFFAAVGGRSRGLFFSRKEKMEFDADVRQGLGDWLVITSIFGTLTSFATYLFLAGSVKLFGWFAVSTGLTIMLSAPVTNALTRPLVRSPRIKTLLTQSDQVASVLPSLFWADDKNARAVSRIIQWISLTVLLSIIWLECTAFVDLSFWLSGHTQPNDPSVLFARFVSLFVVAFLIIFFVLRYGIRGFVFADLLHSPLIGAAALALLGGAAWLMRDEFATLNWIEFTTPILSEPMFGIPWASGWIFAAHVLVLNLFQLVCTEHHWFRMWLLGDTELKRQRRGTVFTGVTWIGMLFIGFVAFAVTGQPGEAAVAGLLSALQELSPVFVILFWVGATAALFSTADMQVYSVLLVSRFRPKTGAIEHVSVTTPRSFAWALGLALLFALIYTAVRAAALPLEKIIFVVVPLCIALLPAFLQYALGRTTQPWVMALSFLGYIGVAAYGFAVPEHNFVATLSAVFVPVAVSVFTLPLVPKRT